MVSVHKLLSDPSAEYLHNDLVKSKTRSRIALRYRPKLKTSRREWINYITTIYGWIPENIARNEKINNFKKLLKSWVGNLSAAAVYHISVLGLEDIP